MTIVDESKVQLNLCIIPLSNEKKILSYFSHLTSKCFQKAVLLWLHDPATRDAKVVRKALTISVVDNQAITEIICSRTPSQLRRLKEVYLSTYHSYLEQDIESKTSGDHKKVLDPPLTPIFLQGIFGCALFLV